MKHDVLLAVVMLVFCSPLYAQESSSSQPFSSDLVLWSYMQQGQAPEQNHPHQQPTPEPLPETQPPENPTPSPPARHPGEAAQPPAGAPIQTFTGLISKEADSYVLKVSASTSYKLDNQEQVQQYEGRRVRVTGTLDPSAKLIHVDKVEPIT
jgi:Protein of unknown function (DUF5818)